MPNLQKKLASNSFLLTTVVDFTKASDALVAKELDIIKGETDLCSAYSTLNPSQRKKSLIYRSLKKVFNPSIYRYENDKENTEDIIDQISFLQKMSTNEWELKANKILKKTLNLTIREKRSSNIIQEIWNLKLSNNLL